MEYKRHHLSASWPDMSEEDFQSLRDSITNVGQLESIILYGDEVLDGWQRYQACLAENMPPRFETFEGDDPVEFISAKHTRRPLNLTQRLTAIALMHQWRPSGVTSHSRSADSADLTAAQIAAKAGGGTRSAENVKSAIAHGTAEVVNAMKAGTLAADHAAQIAKLPKEQQAAAIAAPRPPKYHGKPKKVPAKKWIDAEIKAADAGKRVAELEQENAGLREREPVAEAPPVYSELDRAHDQIADLQAALAIATMGDVSEEDKQQAATLIAELRADLKTANAELSAVKSSRDFLMEENTQMKRQMALQRREIEKLRSGAGA